MLIKKPYRRKPTRFLLPANLPRGCVGLWPFFTENDHRNIVTGADDGTPAAASKLAGTDVGLVLPCDGINSGFYDQTLRGPGGEYASPAQWTDIAFVRPRDFSSRNNPNAIIGHTFGCCREVRVEFPRSASSGDVRYFVDATSDDATLDGGISDGNEENYDLIIIAGGSLGANTFVYLQSSPLGRGHHRTYRDSGANTWGGSTGGEVSAVGHRSRSGAYTVCAGIDIFWAAHFDRALGLDELDALAENPFRWWERRIWVPAEAPEPGAPINLDIDGLRHGRQVDDVNITILATQLVIDALRHGRRLDDIPALGVSVDLFLSSLRHARPVDDLDVVASVDLAISGLRHSRRVDAVDLQELVGVIIDIDDARHARPVDELLLDVDQPILINGLRHARPVDTVDVQLLMGDQTGMGATAAAWVLDAGQSLNNASSIDFGYHVLEGVFDGNQSVLGVDGSRVTGPAGLRELMALTLGADVDGQRRTRGEIAELRIYAGALSQTDRDRITQELATKWITG